jgi:hypothetical protein
MNRATAATAALAMGTLAAAATIGPAMAAPRPAAAHTATRVMKKKTTHVAAATMAKLAAQAARVASDPTVTIGSELDNGQFVTVVTCQGAATPPPITVGAPGTPLTAHGIGPSAGILAMLSKPNPYKTIYTCTVTVEEKFPTTSTSASTSTSRSTSTSTSTSTSKTTIKTVPKVCVTVVEKTGRTVVCHKSVIVSTGFGGMAPQVKVHHPNP